MSGESGGDVTEVDEVPTEGGGSTEVDEVPTEGEEPGELHAILKQSSARKRTLFLAREEEDAQKKKKRKPNPRSKRSRVPLAPGAFPSQWPGLSTSTAEEPSTSGGFRLKKRKAMEPPEWRKSESEQRNMFDFCFENPLDGKFKDLPVVQQLLQDFPALVTQKDTSYCHHGEKYRKRTVFVGTLGHFQPKPPCPIVKCHWLRSGQEHPGSVTDCGQAQRNALPPALIDMLIDAWRQRHAGTARCYLLVDVFSGWGSMAARVKEKQKVGKWADLRVYSNDIVQRGHTDITLDMSANSVWTLEELLKFGIARCWPELRASNGSVGHRGGVIGWVNANKVAVLFHCSTPCSSYSQLGLKSHRKGKTLEPSTVMANDHDEMNASLIAFFKRVVLSPPP
jgi:hypothetical protein